MNIGATSLAEIRNLSPRWTLRRDEEEEEEAPVENDHASMVNAYPFTFAEHSREISIPTNAYVGELSTIQRTVKGTSGLSALLLPSHVFSFAERSDHRRISARAARVLILD